MLDLQEGILELFQDAQAPLVDWIRATLLERSAQASTLKRDRMRALRASRTTIERDAERVQTQRLMRRLVEERRADGLCYRCGVAPAASSRGRCDACAARVRATTAAWRARRALSVDSCCA